MLAQQGVSPGRILGVDASGVPIVCGTGSGLEEGVQSQDSIPTNARAWEPIPSVIRFDGVETFRFEVNANGPVKAVSLNCGFRLLPATGGRQQALRDDGLEGDRIAGDYLFTSTSLRADTAHGFPPLADFYKSDTNSPAGLDFEDIEVKIVELDDTTNEFLITPMVGLLSPAVPATPWLDLSSNIVVTPHLINIRTADRQTQQYLRLTYGNVAALVQEIYGVVDDSFDFLTFLTTDHIELLPRGKANNFYAGLHVSVRINYTGTGLGTKTNSAYMGSRGRLLGLNFLDTFDRGNYSGNAAHELLHQWLVFISSSLGVTDGSPHYSSRSSAASLLGGFQFLDNGDGTFTKDCIEGRNGGHAAPPLDKYMMGLIDAAAVPPVRTYSQSITVPCGQVITNVERTVTIQDIQQLHGVRTPGPLTAQRDFSLGFVVESHDRLLNPTELTYFETLARHFTREIPPADSTPYVGGNWAPIERYFGEGTTWSSYVLSAVQPRFGAIAPEAGNGVRLRGTGFPGLNYTLQHSADLHGWTDGDLVTPGTNGTFEVVASVDHAAEYYRLALPH